MSIFLIFALILLTNSSSVPPTNSDIGLSLQSGTTIDANLVSIPTSSTGYSNTKWSTTVAFPTAFPAVPTCTVGLIGFSYHNIGPHCWRAFVSSLSMAAAILQREVCPNSTIHYFTIQISCSNPTVWSSYLYTTENNYFAVNCKSPHYQSCWNWVAHYQYHRNHQSQSCFSKYRWAYNHGFYPRVGCCVVAITISGGCITAEHP